MRTLRWFLFTLTIILTSTLLSLLSSRSRPAASSTIDAVSFVFSSAQANDDWIRQVSDDLDKRFVYTNISGDGRWATYAYQQSSGKYQVYLAPSDDSQAPEVIVEQAQSYDVSADGSVAYAEVDISFPRGPNRIYFYRDGVSHDLTPCVNHPELDERCLEPFNVAISGDGRSIFLTSTSAWPCYPERRGSPGSYYWLWACPIDYDGDTHQIWHIDTATGAETRLTSLEAGGYHEGPDKLTTDFVGSKIAFNCVQCGGDGFHLYVIDRDGSNQQRLATIYDDFPTHPMMSDDGNWIIFPGDKGGEPGLDIIRTDGSDHRKLVTNDSSVAIPTYYDINYDGSIIAFTGLKDSAPCFQKFNTFLINNDGSGLRCLLERTAHHSSPTIINPRLSHDGQSLVFCADDDLLGTGVQSDKDQVFTYRGAMTKIASLANAEIGNRLYYTLTLRHDQDGTLSASLIDPIPENTTYVPDSAWASQGTPLYSAGGVGVGQGQISWDGNIAPGETVTVTFVVTSTCSSSPPPPEMVENQAIATVGEETYESKAVTAVELPDRVLDVVADLPGEGEKDISIESDGQGMLLQWHDQIAGLTCGTDPNSDVFYRVYLRQRGGAWQEIGSSPNCSRQIQLDPDDLACLKNGDPAPYEWKVVTYDPEFLCREPVETVLNFTTASCRPEIEVEPQFTLAPGYFLDNQSVQNTIKVWVDWNGPAYETPASLPYGDVYFDLNGEQVREEGLDWGARHTFNMGDDWNADFSCSNNTLSIWAVYAFDGGEELESPKTTLQPTVFPFPGWVDWLDSLGLGEFSTQEKAPLVEYTYGFAYPEEPFEATWAPPPWVPYLGGEEVGIEPTQTEASAAGHSDGSGTVSVSGETGLALASLTSEGNLWGQGEALFRCGESLDLEQAELGFSIRTTVEQEAGLVDVIPAVRAAEDWPVVGRIIRWVNSIAQVKGSFTPGVEIKIEFEERDGKLQFVPGGQGTGSLDVRAELATEVCKDLSASVYGGGTPYITVQAPEAPDYLKELGIDLYYGATFQAWDFEAAYERKINCHHPGTCTEVEDATMMTTSDASVWRLIPRREPAAMSLWAGRILQNTGTTTETVLVSPSYARPEPALAVADSGTRLLAYIEDDLNDPAGRSTEVQARIWDGGWSDVALTDDQQPDFAPAVSFDGDGNGLVVWERATLPAYISPSLNITFARSLEIAARAWDGASWGPPVTLTQDSLMDFAPRLAAGADGTVMALWQTGDGTDILGTASHPLTYTYALWDGSRWITPTAAITGLHDVVGTAFATYSSTQATLVYAVDADGVLSTTTDSDLYYSTFDGGRWSGPTRLMNDSISDMMPALAYDADGNRHLLWLRGDPLGDSDQALVWLKNSWDINDLQTVRSARAEGGLLGFTLSRDLNGLPLPGSGQNLVLNWQTMGADGADLAYSVYDAIHDSWGADQTLMSDTDVEAAHSPVLADDRLYLAYHKVTTEFVTRTFDVSPTLTFTVTNVPTPGASSLVFLEHVVGRDLTFDSLSITPGNPGAGQPVTLTAILHNIGALTVEGPQVAFYDGENQIGSIQTLSDLAAGYTTTVQTSWTVPSPATTHTFRVVADPVHNVSETDESNNELSSRTTLADLQIDVLYTAHSTNAVTVTARLINRGVLVASAPFAVDFRAGDPLTGTLVATAAVASNIAAGDLLTLTQALTDPVSLVGLGDTLWAVVDSAAAVTEADETNNMAYAALGVLPDLALSAADIQGSGPITVVVRNTGVFTANETLLTVRQDALTGPVLYSDTLARLGPGAGQAITLTLPAGRFELWARVDPKNVIAESNEGNNLALRTVEVLHRVYLPLVLRGAGSWGVKKPAVTTFTMSH